MLKFDFIEHITLDGEPVCSYHYDLGSFANRDAAEAAMIEQLKEFISWPGHNHRYELRRV